MAEYNLQFLRSKEVLESKEIAIDLLNSYKYHRIGQPICLYYRDVDGKVISLFAIGRENGEGVLCGENCYDIINNTNTKEVAYESMYWGKLT